MNIDIFVEMYSKYRLLGYQPVEFDYFVQSVAVSSTLPTGRESLVHSKNKEYVGSAEQCFIEKIFNNQPMIGDFMAATPCFRDEHLCDDTRLKIFFKLELYSTTKSPIVVLEEAKSVHEKFLDVYVEKTEDGYDLVDSDGMELGSYGERIIEGFRFTYGTGVAFPRMSVAVKRNRA